MYMCLNLCWCNFTFNNSHNCLKTSLHWASTCTSVSYIQALDSPYKCSFQFEIFSHITIVIPRQFSHVRPNWIATPTNSHTLWRISTGVEPSVSPNKALLPTFLLQLRWQSLPWLLSGCTQDYRYPPNCLFLWYIWHASRNLQPKMEERQNVYQSVRCICVYGCLCVGCVCVLWRCVHSASWLYGDGRGGEG